MLYQNKFNYTISIQVSLDGYSLNSLLGDTTNSIGWGVHDDFETKNSELLKNEFDCINISVFTPKFTLVPDLCFDKTNARKYLSDVVILNQDDIVECVALPGLSAVLVYSNSIGEEFIKKLFSVIKRTEDAKIIVYPEIYYLLLGIKSCNTHNKILASYRDGYLYLVIAQGDNLLLCNSFEAIDFTTAQYYIFMALKQLQLNPEVSTIRFRTPLTEDEEMSLYRYFKSVEYLLL